jgi:hypothetical protein
MLRARNRPFSGLLSDVRADGEREQRPEGASLLAHGVHILEKVIEGPFFGFRRLSLILGPDRMRSLIFSSSSRVGSTLI